MNHGSNQVFIPVGADRHKEDIVDANIRIDSLISTVAKHEIIIQAMYELMVEKGIDTSLINAKIVESTEKYFSKPPYVLDSRPCEKCGKPVKESGKTPLMGRCLFCGTLTKFYPTFETENKDTEDKNANPYADAFLDPFDDPTLNGN